MRFSVEGYIKNCSEENFNKTIRGIKKLREDGTPPSVNFAISPGETKFHTALPAAQAPGAVRQAFKASPPQYECLTVPISINGMTFENGIIDTGASHSMISQLAVRKLDLWNEIDHSKNIAYRTASGERAKPWGCLKQLNVAVGGLELPLDNVFITESKGFDMLVGNDWLRQAKAEISYDKQQIAYRIGPEHIGVFSFGPQPGVLQGCLMTDPVDLAPTHCVVHEIEVEILTDVVPPPHNAANYVDFQPDLDNNPAPSEHISTDTEEPSTQDDSGANDIKENLPPVIEDPPIPEELPDDSDSDSDPSDKSSSDDESPSEEDKDLFFDDDDDIHIPDIYDKYAYSCDHLRGPHAHMPDSTFIYAHDDRTIAPRPQTHMPRRTQTPTDFDVMMSLFNELKLNFSARIANAQVPPQRNSYARAPSNSTILQSFGAPDPLPAEPPPPPRTVPDVKTGEHLSAAQRETLNALVAEFGDVFTPGHIQSTTELIKHTINTGDAAPIKQKPYSLTYKEQKIVQDEITDMLSKGVIVPSCSDWASPVVLVPKPDGSTRFCIDFRKLNSVTKKDSFPLPRVDESLEWMSGRTQYMSKVDCKSAFWLIPMALEDQGKTAFITRQGLYEFTVMPFGLTNAPATLQRLMNELLKDLIGISCCIYLDDCLVCSENFEDHVRDLRQVLLRYRAAGLKANPKKSELGMTKVVFLGHVVDRHGIRPNPEKIAAVQGFSPPTNITDVRSFLGLVNYYRRFIPDMARIASPIQNLTRKDVPFIWDDACEAAFQLLKELLTSAPLLRRPNFNIPFILQTDWQPAGMGAILSQNINGTEHVIAYASKSLNTHERHYAPTEGELLACLWAIRHFHCYLHGHPFVLETDHKALTYLLTSKNLSTKLTRYAMELQEYDFEMRHRPGHLHTNVDALSRLLPPPPLPPPPPSPPPPPLEDPPCMYALLPCPEKSSESSESPRPVDMHKRGTPSQAPLPIDPLFLEFLEAMPCLLESPVPTSMHKRGTVADPIPDLDLEFESLPSILMTHFASPEAPVDLTGGESDTGSQKVIYISSSQEAAHASNRLAIPSLPAQGDPQAPFERDEGPPINPNTACRTCESQENPETMLICEGCQDGFHIDCLDPPLDSIPDGTWYCLSCDALGMRNDMPRTNDRDITLDKNVLQYMETAKFSVDWTRQEKQRVYRRAKNYFLQDGHLYFRPNARYHWPRKVPNIEDRPNLIKACHDDLGHFGIVRTCFVLQERFYWSNMTHDVRDFVNSCGTCATKKASFLLPDKLQSFPISARFDRVHIDLMGPFPVTPRGNKYVVCCIDAFTKWPEAAAIPNKEASTVADFFLSDIISRHGAPQTVVSDNGREFDGEFLRLLEDCYIEHRHSSPNHPQTNGLVERFNQTLRQALQKSVKDHKDWDLHLNKILFGYRIGMQASTQCSPFELLYGRPAVIPIQNSCRPKSFVSLDDPEYDANERARQLIIKTAPFQDLYEAACTNMRRAQERQQRDFQQRHIARTRELPEDDIERNALLQDKRHKTQHATRASEDYPYKIIKPPTTPPVKHEDFSRAAVGPSALISATGHRPQEMDSIRDLNTQLQYGDFVMIKNPHKRNKLDKDLIGPYKFISFTDETCTVALLLTNSGKGWKESIYNISPLKKPWENTPLPSSRDL